MEATAAQAVAQAVGSSVVPAVDAGKGIFNCLKRKCGYVRNMKKNFDNLEKEQRYLCDAKNDVKTILDRNKLKKEMSCQCRTWLDEVKKLKDDIKALKVEYDNVHQSFCCLCPFPNLVKLGKRIVVKTTEVVSLKNRIGQTPIMVEKAPAPFVKRYANKIEVPSLNKHVEMLQECLRNVELKRICIWGPPGVGKTTIMENLHDIVGESQQFDIIFWVTLNTNGNVRDIQEVIVEQLHLKAEECSSGQRAGTISDELKNKSYVLFLDGVSKEINLREVGIHDWHEHGKVVFASRYRNICGQTDEDINVRRLSDDDAQKLFWEIVGWHLKDNRDIKPVAKLIVNECGGMPHLVKLIGNRLAKKEDPAIWRHTLSQLRLPTMEPKQELEEVYKFLKLVCDELKSFEQPCLLYWAIFPAGYELHQDYIIDCWRSEQFFQSSKLSKKLREARDEGRSILNDFFEKSLLERGRKGVHYKMFEHFQRAALRIANHDNNSCIILVKESEKIGDEEWTNAKRISLVGSCLSTLPESPECHGNLTLLLQGDLEEFPSSFFNRMGDLQLLDLHDTKIRLLPPSISSLGNLKVLFLNNCKQLMQLPAEVRYLRSLEILDIRQTGIHSLPTEIGQLIHLKCLRVSFVENVGTSHNHVEAGPRDIIAPNIIEKLLSLEELSIDVDPNNGRWNKTVSKIAAEVASLEDLSSLCFYFPDVVCFQTFVDKSRSWNGNNTMWGGNNFRSFSIQVGYHQRSSPAAEFDVSGCSAEKHLRFSAGEEFPNAILKILEHANAFELIGHRTAVTLSDLGTDNLQGLEACIVEECNQMTSIVDGDRTGGVAFQRLKQLHINNLPKLEHIWKGSIQSESFILLTTLTLKGCHGVKTLFSGEMVSHFCQLQSLQIEDCEEIEQIIQDGSSVEPGAFPKLKILQLCCLPKLSNIYHNATLEWPSLEITIIKTCEALRNFPSAFKNAAKLSIIKCTQACWDRLDWPDDDVKDRFESYLKLIC